MTNSINAQQPEDNHEDLVGPDAIAKIKELAEKAGTCFFCTAISAGEMHTRPMAVQQVDDAGNLWFLAAGDSHLVRDLTRDPTVQLLMQGSSHSDFLSLRGGASLTHDKAKIDELWNPLLKTWFTQGKDDPRITVIRVHVESGYYWDTKHNRVVVFAKMIAGALTGKTLDDSIEGNLAV